MGRTVDMVFDPQNTDVLTIEYQEDPPFTLKKLVICERVSEKQKLPRYITLTKPLQSRLLYVAEKQNQALKDK